MCLLCCGVVRSDDVLVMPPIDPLDPPEGDISPYPDEVLILGGDRWLSLTGCILSYPFGNPVELRTNTRRFWEDTAARAGFTLAELLGD